MLEMNAKTFCWSKLKATSKYINYKLVILYLHWSQKQTETTKIEKKKAHCSWFLQRCFDTVSEKTFLTTVITSVGWSLCFSCDIVSGCITSSYKNRKHIDFQACDNFKNRFSLSLSLSVTSGLTFALFFEVVAVFQQPSTFQEHDYFSSEDYS